MVVGVTNESKGLVQKSVSKSKMKFPVAMVKTPEEANYGVRAFPTSMLLDTDGLVIRERRYLTRLNWPGVDRVKMLASSENPEDFASVRSIVRCYKYFALRALPWYEYCYFWLET